MKVNVFMKVGNYLWGYTEQSVFSADYTKRDLLVLDVFEAKKLLKELNADKNSVFNGYAESIIKPVEQ